MLSVSYDAIYSRLYGTIQAFDLIQLAEEIAKAKMTEWMMSIKANPRVRKLFASVSFNPVDEAIGFELVHPIADDADVDFVTELFALGMTWKWSSEKYNSTLNTSQFFAGKEQKFYSQANHMAELANMTKIAKQEFLSLIANRECYTNSYLQEVK